MAKNPLALITTTELVRSPNNYDPNAWSDATGLECKDESKTQQQFAEESDINFIADQYGLTGEMPQVLQLPTYGDFTGVFDFQTAQDAILRASQAFMTLPAKMRARFDNDPQKLLQFLNDPENRAEAEFLGLVNKPQEKDTNGDRQQRSAETPQRGENQETRTTGTPSSTATAQGPQKS